jgi:hypothetical protein
MRTTVELLIDALDRERAFARISRKRPDGREETVLQFSSLNFSADTLERIVRYFPELRDMLACIVLGALPVEIRSPRTIALLRTVLGNAHAPSSEVHSFVLRAYSGASEDLVGDGINRINIRQMIINAAEQLIETAQDTPDAYQAVLHLLENPPPAVLARPEYLHAHRLHMGTVAFVHPQADEQTRANLLLKMADAIDALDAMYSAEPRVQNSPDDATFFAHHLWYRYDALPLFNRLIGFSVPQWDDMWALAYLTALMGGKIPFTPQHSDSKWVSKALYPLLREPLDELFHQRAFAPKQVYEAITNRLREGGAEVYWQFVKNILETEELSGFLLCDLVAGYMRRFPRSVLSLAKITAQQMTSDESVKKFATLVAGATDSIHQMILKMLPPRGHEALTAALRAKYREISSKQTALRNTVAERLLASVYHLLPSTVRAMCEGSESPSAVWNALQSVLVQPDRLLRTTPEKRARFQRWLDNARYEDLITRLCNPPDSF